MFAYPRLQFFAVKTFHPLRAKIKFLAADEQRYCVKIISDIVLQTLRSYQQREGQPEVIFDVASESDMQSVDLRRAACLLKFDNFAFRRNARFKQFAQNDIGKFATSQTRVFRSLSTLTIQMFGLMFGTNIAVIAVSPVSVMVSGLLVLPLLQMLK